MASLAGCEGEPLTEESDLALLQDGGLEEPAPEEPAPAPRPPPRPRLPAAPDPAPALVLPDAETGRPWSLQATLDPGRASCPGAVLLAFLALDCAPCQESLPLLRQLELDHPELAVVAVLADGEAEARRLLLERVRAAGLEGPAVVADSETLATWSGKRAAPLYLYVNRAGRITSRNERFDDIVRGWLPKQALNALK